MRLIVSKTCPYAQRAWITVNALQLKCDIEIIDLQNKPAWFLKLTNFAQVPVLIDHQERVLWESLVISEYLNKINGYLLSPSDDFTTAVNAAWIQYLSILMGCYASIFSVNSQDELEKFVIHFQSKLDPLEKALSQTPYFNGKKFCMIDIFYAPLFLRTDFVSKHFNIDIYQGFPKVASWSEACSQHPAVQSATVPDFFEILSQRFKF